MKRVWYWWRERHIDLRNRDPRKQFDIHRGKKNVDLNFTSYTKINSKWITALNIKYKTIKLVGKNRGENWGYVGLHKKFLDFTPKA